MERRVRRHLPAGAAAAAVRVASLVVVLLEVLLEALRERQVPAVVAPCLYS